MKKDLQTSNIIDGLFLHMGPGHNAQVENKLLFTSFPNIEFWDQPKIANAENAFSVLVEKCRIKVEEIYNKSLKPVHIMAHSFGGHIATALTHKIPDKIASMDFYATGYDIPAGFLNILKLLATSTETQEELRKNMHIFLSQKADSAATKEEFWSYLGLILQAPHFMQYYWPNLELFNKYLQIASQTETTDPITFQNVINDFLAQHFNPLNPSASTWSGHINFYLGEKDPLFNIENEKTIWKKIFPHAQFHISKTSGHFLHLESILI